MKKPAFFEIKRTKAKLLRRKARIFCTKAVIINYKESLFLIFHNSKWNFNSAILLRNILIFFVENKKSSIFAK